MDASFDLYADLSPNLNVHALFSYYNTLYFDDELGACSVEWSSSRMTMCAPARLCCLRGQRRVNLCLWHSPSCVARGRCCASGLHMPQKVRVYEQAYALAASYRLSHQYVSDTGSDGALNGKVTTRSTQCA